MATPNAQEIGSSRQMNAEVTEEVIYSPRLAYHELAEVPVRETNLIDQLHSNLSQLDDLQGRLKFMMREIRYLMKI